MVSFDATHCVTTFAFHFYNAFVMINHQSGKVREHLVDNRESSFRASGDKDACSIPNCSVQPWN